MTPYWDRYIKDQERPMQGESLVRLSVISTHEQQVDDFVLLYSPS